MKKEYDFSLEPGKKKESNRNYKDKNPVISVVIPFYNDKDYIKQSVNSILNQTFPYYEILIIDDGSKDESSLEKLKEVETSDKRIKVFHKENEGLSATRDYGASQSSKTCKYIMFLDSDDLLEPTYLECAYWTLETNEKASWAYSDSVGFDAEQYTWNKWFDSEKLKKENELVSAALVRKSDFLDVGGYELREKAVNEDWNFWLKLIAKGKYPVHMSYYGQWYRRKKTGELKKSKDNKDRALEIIKETASRVTKKVEAIQYPKQDYNYDLLLDKVETILQPEPLAEKSEKINLLFIVPWLITGGADRFNLNLVKGLDKEKYNIIVLTTEPNQNTLRQEFEKYAIVYDLTSFLNQKFWLAFVNYIIKKENISVILNSNSKFGYSILPYLKANNINIPIIDYVHMEEWYNRNGGYSRYSTMLESVIDETLVCNENSKKVLCNYFKRNEKEIKTVYIGVDEEEFNPEKYNIEKNKKYIFSYICRISEQKRPMLLLEIIKKLKEKRNDFKVLVVGDGNLLPKMKTRANNLGLDENIIFLGNIENTEEIYKISDLTINCSIKEGLALTSYESLSMGIPVISSDVGGQKELINEDVGIIVPCMQNEKDIYSENYEEEEILVYIQAIEEVLSNLENYKSKCRQRILNKFTIRNMIKEMSKILEEIKTNSNADKIKNGKNLLNNLNITKELITLNMMNDKAEYNWECTEYEKRAYGRAYSIKGLNYKHELLKERLWKIPLWRGFVKVVHKVKGN